MSSLGRYVGTRQRIVASHVYGTELLTFSSYTGNTHDLINIMNMLRDCDGVYFSPTYLDGELWIAREDTVDEQLKGIELYFLPGDHSEVIQILQSLY